MNFIFEWQEQYLTSQKRQDHFVWSKVRYRLSETLEPAVRI